MLALSRRSVAAVDFSSPLVREDAESEEHQQEREHDQRDVDPPVGFVGVWINPRRHWKKGMKVEG